MKKYIVLIAVLPLLTILMSCNEGGAKADLRKMVDNINRECPIHYDYITCQSAAIQGEEVVMNYIVDESMLSLQLMKEKPDMAKKYGGSSLFNVYDELGSLLMESANMFQQIQIIILLKKEIHCGVLQINLVLLLKN